MDLFIDIQCISCETIKKAGCGDSEHFGYIPNQKVTGLRLQSEDDRIVIKVDNDGSA